MPDDIVEVTEQTPVETVPDTPADEALGFKNTKGEDAGDETYGDLGEQPEKEETTPEVEKPGEEKPETEITEVVDEDDEDVKRGKELLDTQEKEARARADAERARAAEQGARQTYNPFVEVNDENAIQHLRSVIPPALLPEVASLPDGTELNFKAVFENEPEVPVMAVAIAKNVVEQLVANNYLATRGALEQIQADFDNRLFLMQVTNEVPEALKIANDPKFKEWRGKQTKEVNALFTSEDPKDHVRGFKRFLNASGLAAADKKVAGIDRKKAESKAAFDSIYKTTIKSKGKPKGSTLTPEEEEMDGFTSKDDD